MINVGGLGDSFPLLSRIPKVGADLLQSVNLTGFPEAKEQGPVSYTHLLQLYFISI